MKLSHAIARQEGFFSHRFTRARRNYNPGNIKYGPFAKSHGAIDADDQNHAIFPTPERGWKALEALLEGKFKGQSLRQIGSSYAEDPEWASNVARIASIDPDDVVT